MEPALLVVGAASDSLGAAVVDEARDGWGYRSVVTAGINDEQFKLNIEQSAQMREVLAVVQPDVIVCTVGSNQPAGIDDAYLSMKMDEAFRVNVIGPMELLRVMTQTDPAVGAEKLARAFIVISSNSAHVARRGSMAYCASKAALSMAVRVAGREMGGDPVWVWGYEPGLLAGTPMTKEAAANFPGPLHRMPGVPSEGLSSRWLARHILADLAHAGPGLNGCMVRLDGGEQ